MDYEEYIPKVGESKTFEEGLYEFTDEGVWVHVKDNNNNEERENAE